MRERLNVLSLCSGIGGLELGLRLAGVPTREILYCVACFVVSDGR